MIESSLASKYLDEKNHSLTGFHKSSMLKMIIFKNGSNWSNDLIRYFPSMLLNAGIDCCIRNEEIGEIEDFKFTNWSLFKLWLFKIKGDK